MNLIRKGQIQVVDKGEVMHQVAFISSVFGVAA